MSVYIGLYFFLIILSLIEMLYQKKKVMFLTAGTLALFAGFRFFTGFDFVSYSNFYREMDSLGDVFNGTVDAEAGYLLLNYLFQLFRLNYPAFILFFSLLSIGLLANYLYRKLPYPSLVLVYYFVRFFMARDMGQIRGSIASIILLYAIPYIEKRDFFRFVGVVFLASLFHVSSWIFVLAYLFHALFDRLNIKKSLILLTLAGIVGIVVQIPRLYLWLIPDRYLGYFVGEGYTDGPWIMNPVLWMQLLLFFATMLFTHIEKDRQYNLHYKLYFLSSFILIAGGNLSTIGGRLSAPFTTQEMFVAPYLILNFSKNKLLNVLLYFAFTAVIFVLIFIISGDYRQYVPYQTIFD